MVDRHAAALTESRAGVGIDRLRLECVSRRADHPPFRDAADESAAVGGTMVATGLGVEYRGAREVATEHDGRPLGELHTIFVEAIGFAQVLVQLRNRLEAGVEIFRLVDGPCAVVVVERVAAELKRHTARHIVFERLRHHRSEPLRLVGFFEVEVLVDLRGDREVEMAGETALDDRLGIRLALAHQSHLAMGIEPSRIARRRRLAVRRERAVERLENNTRDEIGPQGEYVHHVDPISDLERVQNGIVGKTVDGGVHRQVWDEVEMGGIGHCDLVDDLTRDRWRGGVAPPRAHRLDVVPGKIEGARIQLLIVDAEGAFAEHHETELFVHGHPSYRLRIDQLEAVAEFVEALVAAQHQATIVVHSHDDCAAPSVRQRVALRLETEHLHRARQHHHGRLWLDGELRLRIDVGTPEQQQERRAGLSWVHEHGTQQALRQVLGPIILSYWDAERAPPGTSVRSKGRDALFETPADALPVVLPIATAPMEVLAIAALGLTLSPAFPIHAACSRWHAACDAVHHEH